MVFNMFVAVLFVFVNLPSPSSPKPEPEPFRSMTTTPNIESVILSIEERLRGLDSIYSLRFVAPRWELTLESQNRKLEALESKISRIETLLELRIDKLTEALNSKSLKEELAKDQLSRKIDTVYERLNHRMSYMESRIENNIVKSQTTLDTTLNRISQQLEHIEKTNNEIENDILEVSTGVEETKTMLVSFNTSVSNSHQSDGSIRNVSDETIKKTEKNILDQFNNFATKLSDMYNEMSRKQQDNENMLRKSLDLVNATRRDLEDGVQSLKSYRKHTCQTMPDDALDYLIEKVDTMTRKNDGNYQRLDNTIERLHEKQELYQESCHRLQLKEPQIENRIGEILEKILDSIDNRTYTTDKNYETILERLKSHHSHIVRTVGHTTSTVIKLGEQVSNEFKTLYNDFALNTPSSDKIDVIIMSLQELQDQFSELNFTLTYSNPLSSTPNHNLQVLNNTSTILMLMKTLNENISTIIDKLNEYYRSFSDSFDSEDKLKQADVSQKIFNIFNMTEDDLFKTRDGESTLSTFNNSDEAHVKKNIKEGTARKLSQRQNENARTREEDIDNDDDKMPVSNWQLAVVQDDEAKEGD